MPRYEEVTQRAGSLGALTGLTNAEFEALLPHFEQAFVTYMQDRTIDGQPRTSLRYSTDDTCPLPTLADKRLFMLTYVKQNPIQEVHGQLFGMSQSNANKWIHVLHPVLNQALANPERLPARTAAEKATNRRMSSIRIRIEHAIGGVKRYRIVKDKIRLLKEGMRDAVMETCCGLHNIRLQYRPWHYAS